MMASAAAAVVAVCVVLLHSSLGQQPPTLPPASSSDCPYTGQQQTPPPATPVVPAPSPTSTPTPTLVPSPSPTPTPPMPSSSPSPAAPINNNCSYSDCASQCDQSCRAASAAGIANCPQSDHVAAFNACYESCTSHSCPGKSCVHSGCSFGDCSCHNRDASSCCEQCANAVTSGPDPIYQQCRSSWERSVPYCAMGCKDSCSKNCAQGK